MANNPIYVIRFEIKYTHLKGKGSSLGEIEKEVDMRPRLKNKNGDHVRGHPKCRTEEMNT